MSGNPLQGRLGGFSVPQLEKPHSMSHRDELQTLGVGIQLSSTAVADYTGLPRSGTGSFHPFPFVSMSQDSNPGGVLHRWPELCRMATRAALGEPLP
jgi:hypothetical protein